MRWPRLGWKVSLGLGVVLIGALAYGYQRSNQPLLCYSCHEMREEYRTWSQSSHKAVNCEECHTHPSLKGMVKAKFKGVQRVVEHMKTVEGTFQAAGLMAKVEDVNCLQCHRDIREKEELHYHSLRITHRKHLARGYHCTQCHANLVHGGNAPWKNTPTMESCFKCHDGKQAPNTCGLCHKELGEIKPALYNPEWIQAHRRNIQDTGLDRCRTCHQQDFCTACHRTAEPHPSNWMDQHRIAGRNPEQCFQCHGQATAAGQPKFCKDCHEARREHTQMGWLSLHQQEFRQQPNTCARCHDTEFCADCHRIYKPHGEGWLSAHPQEARAKPESCKTCHVEYFCLGCHRQEVPEGHKDKERWLKVHRVDAQLKGDTCSVCHTPDFCQTCHRTHKPGSHDSMWVQVHGGAALARDESCKACHGQTFCDNCHGISMPHPKGWEKTHPGRAGTKVCAKCHEEGYCTGCHGVAVPHAKNWETTHSAVARDNRGLCARCHADSECQKCHQKRAPASHTKAWEQQHGQAALADRASCLICHKEEASCQACHGLAMPHPGNWTTEKHPAQAQATPQVCGRCHQTAECLVCHKKSPPSSHTSADWKPKGHTAGKEAFCALCHGTKPCFTCHGTQMPHPDDWVDTHKEEASFDEDSICFKCHSEVEFCGKCH